MTVDGAGNSPLWSREQDKAFENALATHPEDSSDLWERIAADVPGKTLEEIKRHYELLVDDVHSIESGCIPLPSYNSSTSDGWTNLDGVAGTGKKGGCSAGNVNGGESGSSNGGKSSRSDQERRKGIAWTEEEHRWVNYFNLVICFSYCYPMG